MSSEHRRAQSWRVGEDLEKAPPAVEVKEAKKAMDSKPFLIDAFIINMFTLRALFDTGCLPYAAFNNSLVTLRPDSSGGEGKGREEKGKGAWNYLYT